MLEQDRITIEKAIELTVETGYRLVQGSYIENDGSCCAASLPAIAAVGKEGVVAALKEGEEYIGNYLPTLAELAGLDTDYTTGLEDGFEYINAAPKSEWHSKGIIDGTNIRLAVARGNLPGIIKLGKPTLASPNDPAMIESYHLSRAEA